MVWQVPGYTGLNTLGSGGFGEVMLARHDASGTLVAIKYLGPDLVADTRFAQMFRSEAEVLASLDDLNVARLYEYVESPLGAAIVMELIDGVSLRQILTHQGGTTPEAALVVLQGSLLGLAAAHRRGVVHRDYKPENVLVNGHGVSKLTDFGIAARAGDRPAPAGTLAYAPPEQFAGVPASPASDVYAATATFYECLVGRPPFSGETAEVLLYQHRSEPVPLDPVPEPLRRLVAAGMAKDPEDRPTDGTTFVTALSAVASRAYGSDWEERGRSHLGEAALLLAALWPSGASPAVQGFSVDRVNLSGESQENRHLWHLRHLRHLRAGRAVQAAVVAGAAIMLIVAGTALAGNISSSPKLAPSSRAVTVQKVALQPFRDSGSLSGSGSSGGPGSPGPGSPGPGSPGPGSPGPGSPGPGSPGPGSPGPGSPGPGSSSSPPVITGVSPDSGGSARGGTSVAISGTGLAGATGVRFGGAAGTIGADSGTLITAASPPGKGTVNITVTTAAGTSAITSADRFTYTAPPPSSPPAVTGVTPGLGGSTRGGTVVEPQAPPAVPAPRPGPGEPGSGD
jgi:eukaryotic-like serine/threonine-protein kinase